MADTNHPTLSRPFMTQALRESLDELGERVTEQVEQRIKEDREEREREQPGGMWRIARVALGADWTVYLDRGPRNQWVLAIWDDHHCLHVEWVKSTDPKFPGKPWRLVSREFRTRCPYGDKVPIEGLHAWLQDHPSVCAQRRKEDNHRRQEIGELNYLPKACAMRHPHPGFWDGPHANPASIENDPLQNGDRHV